MNIKSLDDAKYESGFYGIETPSFVYRNNIRLFSYVVQRHEEMRIDLVMKSIYGESDYFKDLDVILYINGIDNPLEIRESDTILYPNPGDLGEFRYYERGNFTENKKISEKLGVPNKTTRKDSNREKFINNGYSLPPVVMAESKNPVRIDKNTIFIGGL